MQEKREYRMLLMKVIQIAAIAVTLFSMVWFSLSTSAGFQM